MNTAFLAVFCLSCLCRDSLTGEVLQALNLPFKLGAASGTPTRWWWGTYGGTLVILNCAPQQRDAKSV